MHPIQIALLIMLLVSIVVTALLRFLQWQSQRNVQPIPEALPEVDIDLSDCISSCNEFKSPPTAKDDNGIKLPRFAILYRQDYEISETVLDAQAPRVRAWLHDLGLLAIFTPAYDESGELVSGFTHVWTKPKDISDRSNKSN